MADRLRFHLDENVSGAVAMALRRYDIDVTTTPESGLHSASDEDQLAFSARHGRVLVTHDADFLRMAKEHSNHAGIAFCPKRVCATARLIRGLIAMHRSLNPDDMRGMVRFL